MPRMTRGVKWALIIAGCVVLPYLVARWTVYAVYHGKIEAELRMLEAESGSVRLADLSPQAVAAREGRTITLYKADDFAFRYPPTVTKPREAEFFADAGVSEEAKINEAVGAIESWAGMSIIGHSPRLDPKWMDAWDLYAEKYLANNKSVLDAAKAVAAEGNGAFEADWGKGCHVVLRHTTVLLRVTRLIRAEAILRARKGDMPGALDDVRLMFRLRRLIDSDPLLMSKHVAMALDNFAFGALRGVLQFGSPDRASVEKLAAELADHEERNHWTQALLGQTAFDISVFDAVRRNPAELLDTHTYNPSAESPTIAPGSRSNMARQAGAIAFKFVWLWPEDEYFYLAHMRAVRGWTRQDLTASWSSPPAPLTARKSGSLRYPIVSAQLLSSRGILRGMEATEDALLRITRTVLALTLCKADTGAYPATLGALVPQYLPAVPLDPFDGKPLRYKPKGSGFVVYSIGEDMVDSGGKPVNSTIWEGEK
jgi:hypothetical protein